MDASRTVDLAYDGGSPTARGVIAGVIQFARQRADWACRLADGGSPEGSRCLPAIARLTCVTVTGSSLPVVRLAVAGGRRHEVEIRIDLAALVRLAVEHLTGFGIRAIALAIPQPRPDAAAWVKAVHAVHVSGDVAAVYLPPVGGGRRQPLRDWVARLPTPVGIVATSDAAALEVVAACREAGRSVPSDTAIVGVGNDELVCEASEPTLSSVDLGLGRFGQEAARLLGVILDSGSADAVARTVAMPPLRVVNRRSTDAVAGDDPVVAEALRELRQRLADPPPPAQLAAIFGLSRTSLERRLKAAIGRSVHAELLRLRVTEARRLLQETDLPIRDVAAAAGFGSVQYMTTVMKKHAGLTPAQLRQAAGH